MRPHVVLVVLLAALQQATALDIGNAASWSLGLSSAPEDNSAIQSFASVGLAPGGSGYQQTVNVGGEME